ncbi:RagB/SusD family nutrient uptake outer membrane protein [Marinifilum caeruleilacunae]|uniref:RagB/SusD family nutrient uptake outer membrane protein n=1 Tax=Marinifilum caeruleilacunae TaxID=2499076 RepID=A0ABX1WZ60_9BACT|nr:RagB/SusD family nutrient uptake outer membrane protein [Marinifilum caeruleilacunae]NOU61307.1 RagB/SusD family nutrient uptake outer membrane protein [Marinifilum caeruleilacunae]
MNKIIISLLSILILLSSCDENDFLEEDPQDAIYAENLFIEYSGFNSAMNSVYAMMREIKGNGDRMSRDQLWVLNTDMVSSRYGSVNNFTEYASGFEESSDVYDWLYQLINNTNMIIERAEGDVDWQGLSEEEDLNNKNAVVSQARVARAWAYRLLIYAFGPVPLNVNEITGSNYSNAWERNSVEEIKAQMQEDLEFAVANLPLKGDDMTHINGAVARHYLGELYLSLGEFQKASDVLQPLCESSEYSLITNRFGSTANEEDGNYFMDIFNNPYASSGNTETFFVFANGTDLPGSTKLSINDAYINEYRKYKKIDQTAEWYERFGGFGKGRYLMTPWSMFDEEAYDLYARNKEDSRNIINSWIWEHTDGRDNFLYEMNDVRGQGEVIRRYFVYDWNENGVLTDPSTFPLDSAIIEPEDGPSYNDKNNEGDTLYTHFNYTADALGYPDNSDKHTFSYSRKWEINADETTDFSQREQVYHETGYLRISESYLLYAEAFFMMNNSADAAIWINKVRERANASLINADQVSLDFILDERARELVAEEERKITLLRTGKYLERTRLYNPTSMYYVEDHYKLWAFPSSAIDANKDNLLDQNIGYGGSTTVDFTPAGYPDEGYNP